MCPRPRRSFVLWLSFCGAPRLGRPRGHLDAAPRLSTPRRNTARRCNGPLFGRLCAAGAAPVLRPFVWFSSAAPAVSLGGVVCLGCCCSCGGGLCRTWFSCRRLSWAITRGLLTQNLQRPEPQTTTSSAPRQHRPHSTDIRRQPTSSTSTRNGWKWSAASGRMMY